jgi:hypothetical protein
VFFPIRHFDRLVRSFITHADEGASPSKEREVILTWREGRAMAQAVSHRPPTAKARVRSRVSPCGICGEQNGTGTGFSPSTSVFPCQFHSTGAPLLGKGQKIIIFIFTTGLHNKPQGWGASFSAKKQRGGKENNGKQYFILGNSID